MTDDNYDNIYYNSIHLNSQLSFHLLTW